MAKRGRSGKGRATVSDEDDEDKFFEEEADKEDREEDEFDELRSGDGGHDDSDDNTASDKEDQENEEEDEDGDGDEVRKSLGIDETPTGASEDYDGPGYVKSGHHRRQASVRRLCVEQRTSGGASGTYGVKPGGVVPFLESLCAETQYQNLLTRVAKALETKVDIPPIPAAPWATWANVHGFVGHDLYNDAQEMVRLLDWIGDESRMNVLCDMMELTLEAGWKPKRTGPMPRPVKKKGKAADNADETEGTTGMKVAGAAPKETAKHLQQPPRRSTRAVQITAAGLAAGVKITSTPPTGAVGAAAQAPEVRDGR
ncbi:uncharacterized protein BXZ73DRAFT_106207 [Epithele typhae]|uniref:uncharacterized protein n=1 Tax=Epithele typhae TaxID=378194 RepID=UPI002008E4A9|nr:uncharacterized protein BXZ73DRAFT_106207 [Epithele typhae]KAH9915479.1 hypothetical protein BXZ73DRAFT_106207 [Epithele typhae]